MNDENQKDINFICNSIRVHLEKYPVKKWTQFKIKTKNYEGTIDVKKL